MKIWLLCSLLCAAACAGPTAETKGADAKKTPDKPLYDRLGGKPAITAVVDDFIGRVAKDERINARFSNADIPHLKQMLVEQICQASGGPCTYSGKPMKEAHKGQNVTDDEFGAMVEDLKGTLAAFKVGAREQQELVAALGGMKPDIVGQ